MKLKLLAFSCVTGALLSGCAGVDVASLSVKDQMIQVVDPASATVFAIGSEVDPDNPDAPQATEARWREAAEAAGHLKGSADAMMQPAHVRDQGDWISLARQMSELSQAAIDAAAARDRAGFYAASNNLSDNCAACHTKYKNQTL